jgi:osmotically inducible protein OsmC
MQRKASASWKGGLRDGEGTLTTASGVLATTPYSFGTRFEDANGTNPEELIGAAHAGCFSMALSMILGEAGYTPELIDTRAAVSLEQADDGFAITSVHLDVKARVPGAGENDFREAAEKAKQGCPVSKALDVEITMESRLVET